MAYIFVALAYQFCGSLWLSMFRGGSRRRNNGSMYSSIDDDWWLMPTVVVVILFCKVCLLFVLIDSSFVCGWSHTHPFNGPSSGTTQVSRYQKGKTNLDFTEARDSEWQWHQLGRMQVCTLLQTDNHASTPPLSFLQAGCPSCCPTNSVKALKAVNS